MTENKKITEVKGEKRKQKKVVKTEEENKKLIKTDDRLIPETKQKSNEINNKQDKKTEAGEKKAEKAEGREKEKKKIEIVKKDKAIVRGKDLSVSTKHAVAICDLVRNNRIEDAVRDLEEVLKKKKAVPMKGEVPHRKGMAGGRYPVKASKEFIKLLKTLAANCNVNGLEEPYIKIAKADIASRPFRRFGSRRFKRSHIYLEAGELKENKHQEKINEVRDKK